MKLEITANAITSPVNAAHFICTKVEVVSDSGFNMAIKLINNNFDRKPVDSIDEDRCPKYGVWEAIFWREGDETPHNRMILGTTPLVSSCMAPGKFDYGVELYSAEGVTKNDAVHALFSLTFEKMLMALPFEGLGHVIPKDNVDLASWMIDNNLVTLTKNDIRVTRVIKGCKLERLWMVRKGTKPTLKQTLVSYSPERTMRQTMMIEASHHVFVGVGELNQIVTNYLDRCNDQKAFERQAALAGGITAGHPMYQILQYLQQNGFSGEVLTALREEALKKTHLFAQHQNLNSNLPGMMPQGYPYPTGPMQMGGFQDYGTIQPGSLYGGEDVGGVATEIMDVHQQQMNGAPIGWGAAIQPTRNL